MNALQTFGTVLGILATIAGLVGGAFQAGLLDDKAFRFDVFLPTQQPEILEDIVTVRLTHYALKTPDAPPYETYVDPYGASHAVYDKASYFEYVTLRNTNAEYAVRLSSSGVLPEILAVSPTNSIEESVHPTANGRGYEIILRPKDDAHAGTTPSLKMMYTYRNGYQPGHTYFGKNVTYATDRFSAILDFSQLQDYARLVDGKPQACLRRAGEEELRALPVRWGGGVAFVDAVDLSRGDRIRVFWNWTDAPADKRIDCAEAIR